MELHLLIDDVRDINVDITARTPETGKRILQSQPITHLYLDHDLGQDSDGNEVDNGYKVLNWAIENDCVPANVIVVYSNPVGRTNIERALEYEGYKRDGSWWRKL